MSDDHVPAGRTFTRPGATPAVLKDQQQAQEHYATAAEYGARKGEWVRCEVGHKICQLAIGLKYGDLWGSQTFENWQQYPPVPSETNAKCAGCGALYWDQTRGLHFGGGWR